MAKLVGSLKPFTNKDGTKVFKAALGVLDINGQRVRALRTFDLEREGREWLRVHQADRLIHGAVEVTKRGADQPPAAIIASPVATQEAVVVEEHSAYSPLATLTEFNVAFMAMK